ncbi:hypothetical protein DICVIV_04062 [Dictyocaulus viviparus]|uniref:Uncharacterized protein n=1 Tax=Dictyocaulus viviparus TaxID=29172 RepID=A0A0D8Y199_DICVI|nr:hypothetical protein DICVIV_04062 [Dictyocaulus viviparus]
MSSSIMKLSEYEFCSSSPETENLTPEEMWSNSKEEEMAIRHEVFLEYLETIVTSKTSCYQWSDVLSEFLVVFKYYIENLAVYYKELSGKAPDLTDGSDIMTSYHFIIEKAQKFNNFPFSWIRFCELLHDPSKHYKKMESFMRALERVINVTTTITSPSETPENTFVDIESLFFKVDCYSCFTAFASFSIKLTILKRRIKRLMR